MPFYLFWSNYIKYKILITFYFCNYSFDVLSIWMFYYPNTYHIFVLYVLITDFWYCTKDGFIKKSFLCWEISGLRVKNFDGTRWKEDFNCLLNNLLVLWVTGLATYFPLPFLLPCLSQLSKPGRVPLKSQRVSKVISLCVKLRTIETAITFLWLHIVLINAF